MPGVRWSRAAEAKLEIIDPTVRGQLTSTAGEILHYIPPVFFPHDEGFAGEVMWHRGIACGALPRGPLAQDDLDGPWNYFLFYTPRLPDTEDLDPGEYFEVMDICGIADVAGEWKKMGGGTS